MPPQKKIFRMEAASGESLYGQKNVHNNTSCNGCRVLATEIQQLKNTILQQNIVIMETLADLKMDIGKIVKENNANDYITENFPIKNLEQLEELERMSGDSNKTNYIKALKFLLRGNLGKTLTRVLATEVIIECNVDGIQGKTRLKNFKNFYSILLESIDEKDPESALKAAMKIIKKRYHHNVCVAKNKKN